MKPIPLRLVEIQWEGHRVTRFVLEFDPEQLPELLSLPPIVAEELRGDAPPHPDEYFRLHLFGPITFREAKRP